MGFAHNFIFEEKKNKKGGAALVPHTFPPSPIKPKLPEKKIIVGGPRCTFVCSYVFFLSIAYYILT